LNKAQAEKCARPLTTTEAEEWLRLYDALADLRVRFARLKLRHLVLVAGDV
jgi:hypothetical protein